MLVYPSGGTIGTIFSASAEQNSRQPTDISKQKGRLDYIASTFFIVLMESVLCELVSGAISLFYRENTAKIAEMEPFCEYFAQENT